MNLIYFYFIFYNSYDAIWQSENDKKGLQINNDMIHLINAVWITSGVFADARISLALTSAGENLEFTGYLSMHSDDIPAYGSPSVNIIYCCCRMSLNTEPITTDILQ